MLRSQYRVVPTVGTRILLTFTCSEKQKKLRAADERNTLSRDNLALTSLMNCIRGEGIDRAPPRLLPGPPHYALGATLFPRTATLWRPWGSSFTSLQGLG